MSPQDMHNENHEATYCPEDNKLRIYVHTASGRVDRETWLTLKDAGFKPTPKQDSAFVATWSPEREDICLSLIPIGDDIGDEDQSPQERAADRAERFEGYRRKRLGEAEGLADRYETGPDVYGHQNPQRAERAARKRDRIGTYSVTQWQKAEYWQRRTRGVISHALHRSSAQVRRNRILEIEKEIRAIEGRYTPHTTKSNPTPSTYTDDEGRRYVYCGAGGRGGHWLPEDQIEPTRKRYERTLNHLRMRHQYETQMLEAEGGAAFDVEMQPGGFIGGRQIQAINKSSKTGRVVSVKLWGEDWHGNRALQTVNIERLPADAYREPTPQELEEFKKQQKQKPKKPGIINPTEEDARQLQAYWNSKSERKPVEIALMTQAQFSRANKATDFYRTETLFADGRAMIYRPSINQAVNEGAEIVGKLRVRAHIMGPSEIVVITDKKQKPLSLDWEAIEANQAETVEA